MSTSVHTIEKSVHQTNDWLAALSNELELSDNESAFTSLRAVLHSLRDRLPVDTAANLGAQLPLVVRGIYYENWNPSSTPERIRHEQPFIERVCAEIPDEKLHERARDIIQCTLGLLSRELDATSMEKFRERFPMELRDLWPIERSVH